MKAIEESVLGQTLYFETVGGFPSNEMRVDCGSWICAGHKDGVSMEFKEEGGRWRGGINLRFEDLEQWYLAAKAYREDGEFQKRLQAEQGKGVEDGK